MWQVSLVVMIVITCLWSQCECAALGNRSILTSKLYLLFLIKKKAPVVGKAYIRLAKTNNRLCCKPRLKPTRPWGTHRNLSYINSKDSKKKYCGPPHECVQTPLFPDFIDICIYTHFEVIFLKHPQTLLDVCSLTS